MINFSVYFLMIVVETFTLSIFLQKPFNELTYNMIGDDSAVRFFTVEPKTGKVTIKGNLAEEPSVVMYRVRQLHTVKPLIVNTLDI